MSNMYLKDKRLKDLADHILTVLEEQDKASRSALRNMGKFNLSDEQYRLESEKLCKASFILGFVKQVNTIVSDADYEFAETFIRYHHHRLGTFAKGDETTINESQAELQAILSSIIDLFFEDEFHTITL